MRIAKIKDAKQMADTAGHNFRLRSQPNIDNSKSEQNRILWNNLNMNTTKRSGFSEAFQKLYTDLGVAVRKNSVLACEIVVSASPDFFSTKLDEDVDIWAQNQVDFMKKQFGDNCRVAVLHKDEKTPHLHFLISTEEKTSKTFKNRHQTSVKALWQLNAKRWNPDFLKALHTAHAAHNEHHGLIRGQGKAGTVHKPLKQYYKELADKEKALNAELVKREEKDDLLNRARDYIKKAKTVMDEQFENITTLLDVALSKELTPEEYERVNLIATSTMKNTKINKKTNPT